jgi:hypothetical protein
MRRAGSNPWFWGTHTGAELDLIVDLDGERVGVEVKWPGRQVRLGGAGNVHLTFEPS